MSARGGFFRGRWWHPPAPQPLDLSTLTFSLPNINGDAAITEAADSLAATGAVEIAADAAITEVADTASAIGTVAVGGTGAITEAADTAAGTGAVAIAGSSAITEARDTTTATGAVAVAGASSTTEAADTASGTGAITVGGAASITEAADTASGAGTVVLSGPITGDATITERADTLSSSGSVASPIVPGAGGEAKRGQDPDAWWKSPPRKRRKAKTTDTGAPIEAPLSVSDAAQLAAERAREELLRTKIANDATMTTEAQIAHQRLLAQIAEAEMLLLLAA